MTTDNFRWTSVNGDSWSITWLCGADRLFIVIIAWKSCLLCRDVWYIRRLRGWRQRVGGGGGAVIFLWPNYIWNSGRSNHDCITKSRTFRYSVISAASDLLYFKFDCYNSLHCSFPNSEINPYSKQVVGGRPPRYASSPPSPVGAEVPRAAEQTAT